MLNSTVKLCYGQLPQVSFLTEKNAFSLYLLKSIDSLFSSNHSHTFINSLFNPLLRNVVKWSHVDENASVVRIQVCMII